MKEKQTPKKKKKPSPKTAKPKAKKPRKVSRPRVRGIHGGDVSPLLDLVLFRARPEHVYRTGFLASVSLALLMGWFFFAGPGLQKKIVIQQKIEQARTNEDSSPLGVITQHQVEVRKPEIVSALSSEFSSLKTKSLEQKIEFWSSFIERNDEGRQKISELVEERSAFDTVPLVPKRYNCTTFVETVAALARSSSPSEFQKNLMAIRYHDGIPSFATRNHFPELDWIPNNEKAHILSDITEKLAANRGYRADFERKNINRASWLAEQVKDEAVSRSIASVIEKDWSEAVEVALPYVSVSKIQKILADVPSGTVVNLVHRNSDKYPVLISHQGFIIKENGQVFLRHASTGGEIRTTEFNSYLQTKLTHHQHDWPLIGLNFNQINDSKSPNSLLTDAM